MSRSATPLSDADYIKINKTLNALELTHQEIQRALAAGFECQPEDARCQDLIARLVRLKQAYFPERP